MRTLTTILALMLSGCTMPLRDLYVNSAGKLRVEGSWEDALGASDMTGEATAMLYGADGTHTDWFNTPDHVIVRVPNGNYGVLVFNGAMFSETQTNLDHVYFRNTASADTFEAVAEQAAPNAKLAVQGEYVADNDMEPLASAWGEASVSAADNFQMEYENGYDLDLDPEEWRENTLSLDARPLTWYVSVVVYAQNPASVKDAVGALRGLVRSRYMKSGEPSELKAAYHIPFNALYLDPRVDGATPTGTIQTPAIVTFGPPSDAVAGGTWTCEFTLDVLLQDGTTWQKTFDVRRQIIDLVRNGRQYNSRLAPHIIEIGDDTPTRQNPEPDPFSSILLPPRPAPKDPEPLPLPYIEQAVGVDPWDDGEVIVIRPKVE